MTSLVSYNPTEKGREPRAWRSLSGTRDSIRRHCMRNRSLLEASYPPMKKYGAEETQRYLVRRLPDRVVNLLESEKFWSAPGDASAV